MGSFFKSPTVKALLWFIAALVAEGIPVGIVFLLAKHHAHDPKHLLWEYLGNAGPAIIGFGALLTALSDVAIDESTPWNIGRGVLEMVLPIPARAMTPC